MHSQAFICTLSTSFLCSYAFCLFQPRPCCPFTALRVGRTCKWHVQWHLSDTPLHINSCHRYKYNSRNTIHLFHNTYRFRSFLTHTAQTFMVQWAQHCCIILKDMIHYLPLSPKIAAYSVWPLNQFKIHHLTTVVNFMMCLFTKSGTLGDLTQKSNLIIKTLW